MLEGPGCTRWGYAGSYILIHSGPGGVLRDDGSVCHRTPMLSHEENISNAPVEFQSSRCYRRVPACVAGDPATFNISDDARRVCVCVGGAETWARKTRKKSRRKTTQCTGANRNHNRTKPTAEAAVTAATAALSPRGSCQEAACHAPSPRPWRTRAEPPRRPLSL